MIFKFKDMELTEFPLLKIGKRSLDNYAEVADEFREKFGAVMEQIFDLEEPIFQSLNPRCCRFCKLYGKVCQY